MHTQTYLATQLLISAHTKHTVFNMVLQTEHLPFQVQQFLGCFSLSTKMIVNRIVIHQLAMNWRHLCV